MNIFLRELRSNLKSLLIWSGIMILLVLVGLAKFAAYYNNPSSLEILSSLPKGMVDAMSLQAFNLTTLSGLYGILFVFFGLLGGIAAAMWGSTLISKEERDKTVEFTLVLPVSRARIVTAKALAAAVDCVIFVLVTWVMSVLGAQSYKPDRAFQSFLALEMAAMLVVELVFLAVGLLLGCAMKRYKRSGSVAVAILLVAYFLSVVTGLQTNLGFLRYFTPLKYFDPARMLRTGSLEGGFLALSAGIVVVCLAAAYGVYRRRDLYL
ncbi:MAG TPA: ABC transporter permease subunit [Spirochaetia bacterium]|nr:ABC transporter permease subunit [Spirochaetia bacterium]